MSVSETLLAPRSSDNVCHGRLTETRGQGARLRPEPRFNPRELVNDNKGSHD